MGPSVNKTIAVIGAGICGLAHTWALAKRGYRVQVFERNKYAEGASIRNFGMIWPIGQPFGRLHDLAMASRELWKQAATESGIWFNPCGSLHVAHHDDELAVLEEYVAMSQPYGVARKLLTSEQVLHRSIAVNRMGLRGGLYSETELAINPPVAMRGLADWLRSWPNVEITFNTGVQSIYSEDKGALTVLTTSGERIAAQQAIVCSGSDIQSLFPVEFTAADLKPCKLQMMRTVPQANAWRVGPHLAGGLTLRHYRSFENCPTSFHVRSRIARDHPELDQYGIHVMATQNELGEVVLGDSHEYGAAIEPFDKQIIDDLILRELQKIFVLSSCEISSRWTGIYAKNTEGPYWTAEPLPGVYLFNGLGGNGMTLAFGIAEEFWTNLAA